MPSLFPHTEKVDIKSSPLFPFSPPAINYFQSLPFPLPPLFSVLHPAPRHATFFCRQRRRRLLRRRLFSSWKCSGVESRGRISCGQKSFVANDWNILPSYSHLFAVAFLKFFFVAHTVTTTCIMCSFHQCYFNRFYFILSKKAVSKRYNLAYIFFMKILVIPHPTATTYTLRTWRHREMYCPTQSC